MAVLNWLNRVFVVVVLVLVFALALALAIAPAVTAGVLRNLANGLAVDQFSAGHIGVAAVAVPIALIALGLIVLELRVRRPGAVELASGGGAHLATETIVERLREDVEALPQVDRARPVVRARRRSVDVDLGVSVAPHVEVPAIAEQVREVARATVERLGLKLGRLNVQLSQSNRGWPEPPADAPAAIPEPRDDREELEQRQ